MAASAIDTVTTQVSFRPGEDLRRGDKDQAPYDESCEAEPALAACFCIQLNNPIVIEPSIPPTALSLSVFSVDGSSHSHIRLIGAVISYRTGCLGHAVTCGCEGSYLCSAHSPWWALSPFRHAQ